MKGELIRIIKILGVGINEIIIEIKLDNNITINSIELDGENLYLHTFIEDFDSYVMFEDIELSDQKTIYNSLRSLLYN